MTPAIARVNVLDRPEEIVREIHTFCAINVTFLVATRPNYLNKYAKIPLLGKYFQ